jgi:capsular exopolysaccharide synthesis family protein
MNDLSSWHIRRLAQSEDIQPEYSELPAQDEVHLLDFWKLLVKRRRLVILLFLLVFVVTAYVNFSATPLYTASAMLQIEPQNPAVTGLAEILSSKPEGSTQYDYYQTQYVLLRSRTLAARVITSLQLASDPTFRRRSTSDSEIERVTSWILTPLQLIINYGTRLFSPTGPPKEAVLPHSRTTEPSVPPSLIIRYLRFLKVTPVKNTRLVEIAFSTPDPRLSQKLANAHAAGFIRMVIDNRAALTDEAREFLDKKNAELRAKLEQSEQALNRFRQTHGVVSLDKGENIVVDRLVALNSQLTTARAQRIEAESLHLTVANKKYQDLSQIMTQGSIPQLKNNLATLEAEKARLSAIFKPDHPRIQELGAQISAAQGNLNSEIANVIRGFQSSFVAARAREEALQREAEKQEQKALELKHIGVQYAVLQEDVNVNRALYESVLKRLSETNVSNDLAISNMQITQRADLPILPSSPNTTLNLLLGSLVGLFLGVGTAFLLDYVDNKMSTPEHVERAVALNTLGVVPDLNGLNRIQIEWNRGDQTWRTALQSRLNALKEFSPRRPVARKFSPNELLLTKHHPQSLLPESYRAIRTSLLFSRPERPPQVILFTSASPGEGKTGTSLNLSIALAQDGHRVLIIDADLRKGCCHARLGMSNHQGLSNILTGKLALKEAIQLTPIVGLSLLSCGVCPPSPADLLGSNKMKEVLTTLRELFDFIIIDTPPAVALTDASVLSVLSDAVVLVFHGRKTTTVAARQLIERLDRVRAPVIGVVLNGVDLQNPDFSYFAPYGSYYSAGNLENAGTAQNGNGLDAAIHWFNRRSESAQSGAIPTSQEINVSPDVSPRQASIRQQHENVVETLSTENSSGKIIKEDKPERLPTGITEVVKDQSFQEGVGTDLIPRESLDRLIVAISKSIGPTGPFVVHEQIRALGESYGAFPRNRISELIKLLQQQIMQRNRASQA